MSSRTYSNKINDGEIDLQRLKFRRQFFLMPHPIDIEGDFCLRKLPGGYNLYTHLNLSVCELRRDDTHLILLGYMISPEENLSDLEILKKIFNSDPSKIIQNSFLYAGRYILIIIKSGRIIILNDPATARKVFFSNYKNQAYCASQPYYLAELLHRSADNDQGALEFFNSSAFKSRFSIGLLSHTPFKEVFQVPPNHFYDVSNNQLIRFWPCKMLKENDFEFVVSKSAAVLKGYLNGVNSRFKTMQALTAGLDSRIILAVSKELKDKIPYYVNNPGSKKMWRDIYTPYTLSTMLDFKFMVSNFNELPDKHFATICRMNYPTVQENRIRAIYNYFVHFENYVNVSSNFSEIARKVIVFPWNRTLTGMDLSNIYFYTKNFQFPSHIYEKWLQDNRLIFRECNVNELDMFYWEERMSNWGSLYQNEKDIAQEEFWPFNSRYLMEIMLSAAPEFRREYDDKLSFAIIKEQWPEILKMPVNSPIKLWLLKMLVNSGLNDYLIKTGIRKPF